MKKVIFLAISALLFNAAISQDVSVRVRQTAFSGVDPDGAGPATGSVTLTFDIMATGGAVLADAFGIGAAFQTLKLMPATSPNVTALGPLATLVAAGWVTSNNLATNGNPIANENMGGQIYDRRFLIGYAQGTTGLTFTIPGSWTPIISLTMWTKGVTYPEGGYIVIEPGSKIPQHSVSADGGNTEYALLSPGFPTPIPLGATVVPVTFTKFDAKCNGNGTLISWETAQESNSRNFEIQKSVNGTSWETVATVAAAGNSSDARRYSQLDLAGGTAFYRIKQLDKDGQFIYTSIERTTCEGRNIQTVIYPVPARDVLNVVIKSDRSVKTQLMLFETSGKLVRKVDVSIVNGNNTFRINTIGLAAGEYLIRSSNAEVSLSKQFTVVN